MSGKIAGASEAAHAEPARHVSDAGLSAREPSVAAEVSRGKQAPFETAQLHRAIAALARAVSPRDVIRVSLTECLEAVGAVAGLLHTLAVDGAFLDVVGATGLVPGAAEAAPRVALATQTAVTAAFLTQRAVVVDSRELWLREYPGLACLPAAREGTRIVFPLVADGRALGTISYGFDGYGEPATDRLSLIEPLAGQCALALDRARLYEAERSARAELEAAQRRSALLLEASTILASSLEYDETLSRVARLAVGRVADLCMVDLASDQGRSVALEIAHVDARKREIACELRRRFPVELGGRRGTGAVVASGKPALFEQVSSESVRAAAYAPEQLRLMLELGLPGSSAIVAPIIARGRALGAITLVSHAGGRRYDDNDLKMVEDLAHRAALAIDHTRLYLETREAVRAREDLLGMVSHDLRNPIAGMLMRCRLLLESIPERNGVRADIEAMSRSAQHMQRMLGDLMDFASIQSGHLSVERRPYLLSDVLGDVKELLDASAGKRTVDFDTAGLGAELRVHCDRQRLSQVFSNLVGNAIKFTSPNGRIRIAARAVDGEIRFAVQDDGPGIARQQLTKIFQKYWQRPQGPRSGVGLGLYISKMLVEAHGGRIWADSTPGQGSTVWFTMPLAVGAHAHPQARHGILLVDDDAAFRRELAEILGAEGHTVVESSDGRQALNHLRTKAPPNLILLDLLMPAMDGWEFAATVRADPLLSAIPLVVMSNLEKVEINAALMGAAGHVRKPPHIDQLIALAARYDGESAAARARRDA